MESGSIKCDLKIAIETIITAIEEKLLTSRFLLKDLLHVLRSSMMNVERELHHTRNRDHWEVMQLSLVYHEMDFQRKVNSSDAAMDTFQKYQELITRPIKGSIRIFSLASKLCSDLGKQNDIYC